MEGEARSINLRNDTAVTATCQANARAYVITRLRRRRDLQSQQALTEFSMHHGPLGTVEYAAVAALNPEYTK
jgi:hypothetical protein